MRDLELLGTFLAVYRAGSISAAAAGLGLSQPSVSERLARLEVQFGRVLFERSPRGVTPTAAGDQLATRVGEPIDRLRGVWSTPRNELTGTVRIGGASDVVASRIVPALAPLAAGGIRLEFTLGLAQSLLDVLAEGALDLVISAIRPTRPGVRARGLVDEEFALVGSPALARSLDRARLAQDPAAALAHVPLVAYDDQLSIIRRYWRSEFGTRPTNPVAVVVPDLRAILAAVVAGVGMSAVPRYLADSAIVSGQAEVLHHPEQPPLNTLYLAVPKSTQPSAATTAVIARLMEQAKAWDSL